MYQCPVNLLDLPNEIILIILRKLPNIYVLYSLFGTNNERLESLSQEHIFTDILSFIFISQSTGEISSISSSIIDKFCMSILPIIDKNIKSLTIESVSMERILGSGIYPNLTQLKIYNFNKSIISRYFRDDSSVGHICKKHIQDLVLVINDIENYEQDYSRNVYAIILTFLENLNDLRVISTSIDDYPSFSLDLLSPMYLSSSTLTKLSINLRYFDDCLFLLDGRFNQLTTLIVKIDFISRPISTYSNRSDLSNLKCFSLICYTVTQDYDNLIVPLVRRMISLEELSLYVRMMGEYSFISGTHLDNEILCYMPRLYSLSFYFGCDSSRGDSSIRISNYDIERTFTNIKNRPIACFINKYSSKSLVCHVFSLPFKFDRLINITNDIPNILYNSVTDLTLKDQYSFKYEFFIRVVHLFPYLKSLSINTILPPNWRAHEHHRRGIDWCSIIEYPHLISLDIESANSYYAEHFLNETKTVLPRLSRLKIRYEDLEMVTNNFTRNETRRNCANVKRIIIKHPIVYSKDVYHYFPLLSH